MARSYDQRRHDFNASRAHRSAVARVVRGIVGKADWSSYRQPSYETVCTWVEEAYEKGLKNGAERAQRRARAQRRWHKTYKQGG